MRALLAGIAVLSSLTSLGHAETCAPGLTAGPDTQGHCCWPAQRWSGQACTGAPVCPNGTYADGVLEICVWQTAPLPAPAQAGPAPPAEAAPPAPPAPPPEARTFPVRFEAKRPDRALRISARVDDSIAELVLEEEHPERVGLVLEHGTTPCTLNLPEGRVLVKVLRPEGENKFFLRSLLVPPRPSVATVDEGLGVAWLFWSMSFIGAAALTWGVYFDVVAASCSGNPYENCVGPTAAAVALTVGGAALIAGGSAC